MATAAQVPWTTPGGTPCCCDDNEGDSCPADLLDFLNWSGTDYARVLLTQEDYALMRTPNTELVINATVDVSGTSPIGPVTSYFPNPLLGVKTFSFPAAAINLVGYGATRCFTAQSGQSSPTLVFLYNSSGLFVNATLTFFLFTAVLQDVGGGIDGDYPLTQPALYIKGTLSTLVRGGATHTTIFGSGSGSGTAFGQSIPLKSSVSGSSGLIVTTTCDIAFAAP